MPPAVIAIVIGFFVLLMVSFISYKKTNQKFTKDIEEQYPPKEAFGAAYVTERGELLFRWSPEWVPGYKKWNLSDIAYIGTFYSGEFCVLDKNGQAMRGEYLAPSKYSNRRLRGRTDATLYIGRGKINGFLSFVKKHAPHIQHTIDGKVV